MSDVLISAGEASGDRYAAWLAQAVQKRDPSTSFFGCAGDRLKAAGCEVTVDAHSLATVGLREVISDIPRIYRHFRHLLAEAERRKPRLAVRLTKSSGYSRTVTRSLGTLLPGDSTSIEIFWPTKLAGRYTIKACAQGGGLAAPTCNTGSAVAPAAATTPSKNPGAFPLHSSAPASTATHSSPPTLLIVLVAVLGAIVLIGGSVLVGARLGRRKAAGAPPGEGAPRER